MGYVHRGDVAIGAVAFCVAAVSVIDDAVAAAAVLLLLLFALVF